MHYPYFGEMAASLTEALNKADIPAAAAMSEENPAVEKYEKKVAIIKMPKKGGIGLNDSFKNMAAYVSALAHGEDVSNMQAMLF